MYQDAVQSALIDDRVERLREIHGSHIHLHVLEVGSLFLVLLGHCLRDGLADVDVGYGLVALVEHLFRKTAVASSDIEHSVLRQDRRNYVIADLIEALIPVEWIGVPILVRKYLVYRSYQYSALPYWLIVVILFLSQLNYSKGSKRQW